MKFAALIILFFVNLALSGPARRGCGEEKCYDAVNECGMTYGGYVRHVRAKSATHMLSHIVATFPLTGL